MYVQSCMYMYMYIHACVYIYAYIYMYVYIHTHTYTHTHIYIYCMRTHIYIHICKLHAHTYIYIYIRRCVCFFPSMKLLGITAPSFLHPLFRSLLGRCCGAHGLLAGLLAAVPGCSHSAASRAAKWLLGGRVLEAAVLAGGVLTGLTCLGGVSATFFPEHLVLFHDMTKIALPRACGLAFRGITKPAGPLARVAAAAVHCALWSV